MPYFPPKNSEKLSFNYPAVNCLRAQKFELIIIFWLKVVNLLLFFPRMLKFWNNVCKFYYFNYLYKKCDINLVNLINKIIYNLFLFIHFFPVCFYFSNYFGVLMVKKYKTPFHNTD